MPCAASFCSMLPAMVVLAEMCLDSDRYNRLERDSYRALANCLSMIFSENRFPPRIKCGAGFFRIMLQAPVSRIMAAHASEVAGRARAGRRSDTIWRDQARRRLYSHFSVSWAPVATQWVAY